MADAKRTFIAAALTGAFAILAPAAQAQGQADVEAAKAFVERYSERPSPFPITEPLLKKPTGKKIAVVDCGSPICGIFADIAEAPANELGMMTTRIKSGTTADGVATAFDTVLDGHFDGVFVPALAPSLWDRYLDKLNAAHIAVVASGIIGLDQAKVPVAIAAEPSAMVSAAVMADWAVARDGGKLNTVFYTTPEISFIALIATNFVKDVKARCPTCQARVVEIPVATFGNKAPSIVVDDLLAHPKTTSAVFAVGEQAIGLASALKTADIKLPIFLNSPDPSTLAQIQDGTYEAGFGSDLALMSWMAMDSLARLTTGQAPSEGARKDELVVQVLHAADLKGDLSHGWSGYPDFPRRFKALWANAK
jgi:ribose transport system substrate-binding protein